MADTNPTTEPSLTEQMARIWPKSFNSGWISIAERLPTGCDGKHSDSCVLCWFTGAGKEKTGNGSSMPRGAYPVSSHNVAGWGDEISHWQPMPDAPK
jgi:uncharacterized protein DUF551